MQVMFLKLKPFINLVVCQYGHRAGTGVTLRLSAIPYNHALSRNALSSTSHCEASSPSSRTLCQAASSAAMSAVPPEPIISRAYPDEPRVGIGVVMLRKGRESGAAEVLLVRRAKAPEKGKWTVPGGSLELGETMVDCAIREAFEETGLRLRNDPQAAAEAEAASSGVSCGLEVPTPFAAADVIVHDKDGRLSFHYAIIEVAALPEVAYAPLSPGGDVDGAQWKVVSHCRHMADLTKNSAKIAEEAANRFSSVLR